MALNITKSQIDECRAFIKEHKPYDYNAPELQLLDGAVDSFRLRATMTKKFLEENGIDPYDDNDYGEAE